MPTRKRKQPETIEDKLHVLQALLKTQQEKLKHATDAIRAATEDIQEGIDAIFNVETIPNLEDIEDVRVANKKIQLALDALLA